MNRQVNDLNDGQDNGGPRPVMSDNPVWVWACQWVLQQQVNTTWVPPGPFSVRDQPQTTPPTVKLLPG